MLGNRGRLTHKLRRLRITDQAVKGTFGVMAPKRKAAEMGPAQLGFAAAANSMKSHLDAVAAINAVDQTGYGNDPFKLLRRGKLLAGPDGELILKTQIKPSVFLRSQFPKSQYRVAT